MKPAPILHAMISDFAVAMNQVVQYDRDAGDPWHLRILWRDAMDAAYELAVEIHREHGGILFLGPLVLIPDNESCDIRVSEHRRWTRAVRGAYESCN